MIFANYKGADSNIEWVAKWGSEMQYVYICGNKTVFDFECTFTT